MEIISRIGTFFILVGSGVLVLFFASDLSGTPVYSLFFIGLGILFLGFTMRRRAAPPPPSDRFHTLRKLRSKEKKKEEKKK